jgi:hypothetical protein
MSQGKDNYCLRCFRKGHTYNICNYTQDAYGNIIKPKGIEIMEVFNGKYYVNYFNTEKCARCHKRKHINPKCHNSIFVYAEDLD